MSWSLYEEERERKTGVAYKNREKHEFVPEEVIIVSISEEIESKIKQIGGIVVFQDISLASWEFPDTKSYPFGRDKSFELRITGISASVDYKRDGYILSQVTGTIEEMIDFLYERIDH